MGTVQTPHACIALTILLVNPDTPATWAISLTEVLEGFDPCSYEVVDDRGGEKIVSKYVRIVEAYAAYRVAVDYAATCFINKHRTLEAQSV